MNESIKLKVPKTPDADVVSVGNLRAELKPESTIETGNRGFADFLVENYGLEETGVREEGEVQDAPPAEDDFGYPADFPARETLTAANIPFETVKSLSVEQLVGIDGIGQKTAEKIAAYEVQPQNTQADLTEGAENTDAETNGGAN